MNKTIIGKVFTLTTVFAFIALTSFSQYSSLSESPMFKNNRKNYFQDSATSSIYTLSHMDSLYKTGKSPFQIFASKTKGDSLIWQIKFITELPTIRPKWINQMFPVQTFTDLYGNEVKQDDLKGKILIVNCWSISCGPCVKEIPSLNKLADSLGEKDFVFLALTFDKPNEVKDFFRSEKLKKYLNDPHPVFNFHLIVNQGPLLHETLGVINYPTTFIVDRDGQIKEILEGVNLDDQKNPKVLNEIMTIVNQLR